MRLTETQKNFKKQMASIKPKEKSIYDTTRSGNPFGDEGKARQRSSYFTKALYLFAIPICSLLIPYIVSQVSHSSNPTSLTPIGISPAYTPTTSVSAPVVINVSGKKSVSKTDNIYLNSFTIISNNSEVISKQNLIPVEQRDQSMYKKELLNAIVLCDNEKKRLSGSKPSPAFQPIANLTVEYISSRRNAYKHYLDYISSKNNSDNDLGNNYLTMGNGHWTYSIES